jgi:hypothetical protein
MRDTQAQTKYIIEFSRAIYSYYKTKKKMYCLKPTCVYFVLFIHAG